VRRLPADPGGPGGSGQGPPASRPRDLAPLLFGLEVADDGPVSVVRLSGELDVASRDQVRDQLTSLTSPTVAVDIETLTFLDASGLSALLAAKRAIESRGGSWSLKGARGIVRRVISMADLTQELGMSA
jgi:anti-sigma B factor antagonist